MHHESARIAESQPDEIDLSVVQARTLGWLALPAEAHDEQATDAERRSDVDQAMGWFADAMRLRDVINVVNSIEIPLPAQAQGADRDKPLDNPEKPGRPAGGLTDSAEPGKAGAAEAAGFRWRGGSARR